MAELSIHKCHDEKRTIHSIEVVFVHGIGGDLIETWHPEDAPDDFWPKWLATDRPEAAVWTLGYPAEVTKWSGDGSGMALPDRAKQVLDYLIALGFGRLPLLFIAHSLGGLLVKQIIRASADLALQRYQKISEMTRGVVFLATPHAGSDLSNFANGLRIFRPTVEVKDLEAHSPYLQDLSDWYRNNAPNINISTHAYRENQKLAGKLWVVDPTSADPGIAGAVCIPQDEDHFTIAKPSNKTHPVYVAVTSIIATISQMEAERKKLRLEVGDVALSVQSPSLVNADLDHVSKGKSNFLLDSEYRFGFELPTTPGWSKPERMDLWRFLLHIGLSQDIVEAVQKGMPLLPMGQMLAETSVLWMAHGEPIVATITEETTTKPLEVFLERFKKLTEDFGQTLDEGQIAEIRKTAIRQQLPMSSFRVQNSFAVLTMQKELARKSPLKPTLANLFLQLSQQGGGGPVDKLVANEGSILWGSTVTLRNVEIDGELRELTANTMNLLTEGKDYFYQVGIYYSPQTEDSLIVWNQLQTMAQSFNID